MGDVRLQLNVKDVRDSNQYKGECLMETNTQEELKAHLMATSEEFRGLAAQHAQLHTAGYCVSRVWGYAR